MADISQAFVDQSRKFLTGDLFPKVERCLERLTDEQIWRRTNAASNSIGNLLLHLAGNVRQWIVCGIGGAADNRNRQQEFDERSPIPGKELLAVLRAAVEEADGVLSRLEGTRLLEERSIQGKDVTILEAIYHVVEHFSMHTGQIILLTKQEAATDLAFYDLSDGVPRGRWQQNRQ